MPESRRRGYRRRMARRRRHHPAHRQAGRRGAHARAGPRRRQVAEQGREGAPARPRGAARPALGPPPAAPGAARRRPRPRRGGDARPVDGGGVPAVSVGTEWPALPVRRSGPTRSTRSTWCCRSSARCASRCRPRSRSGRTSRCTCRRAGLTTGPVPSNAGSFDVEADLLAPRGRRAHRRRRGRTRCRCEARPVAEFWTDFNAALQKLGIDVELSPEAQEVPDPIPFPDDTTHASYDPAAATRLLARADRSSSRCSRRTAPRTRARCRGCSSSGGAPTSRSPASRASRARRRPGPDCSTVGRYDYEQMSVGWWPGNAALPEAGVLRVRVSEARGHRDCRARRRRRRRGTPTSASSSSTTTTCAPRRRPRPRSARSSTPRTKPAPPAPLGPSPHCLTTSNCVGRHIAATSTRNVGVRREVSRRRP